MGKYIILSPDTFLWFTKREGLLYNCKSNNLLDFICDAQIYKYCTALNKPLNLYSVKIQREDEADNLFQKWIEDIVSLDIGKIHITKNTEEKKISFPPLLNLRNEIENQESNESSYTNTIASSTCINEVSIFMGGPCMANNYYKQIIYPINSDKFMDYDCIVRFFASNNTQYIKNINVICSDILPYKNIKKLFNLIESFDICINYYFPDKEIESIKKAIDLREKRNSYFNFYFTSMDNFIAVNSLIRSHNLDCNWIFLVDEFDKFLAYKNLIKKFNLKRHEIYPVLTESNKSFFKKNVFTSILDIKERKYTKRMIFCNQVINSNFWGSLFMIPNGEIYDNLNSQPLGRIEDDIMKILSNKIKQGDTSWQFTRDKVEPCKNCNYKYICPPPSNYECYTNKFDMCFKENYRHI